MVDKGSIPELPSQFWKLSGMLVPSFLLLQKLGKKSPKASFVVVVVEA